MIILLTAFFALIVAFILGFALGFFKKVFAVETDPRVAQIREALPGVNCGACGYPGCDGYAAAIASGEAEVNRCAPGGQAAASKIGALMGVSADAVPQVAILACQGSKDKAPLKGDYVGIPSCRGAKISAGGTKLCAWGCLGFGDCVKVCPFGAIAIAESGLPVIDRAKCTGCRRCVTECPQGLLQAVGREQKGAKPLCSNRNPVKAMVLKTCKAGCIKCELCVKNCPASCIVLENGIPKVDYAACTSCGACVSKCPTKAFKMLETA